jgi:hypothetical protein
MSGIGEQCLGGLDVVLREFRRTASSAARAPRGGKARLGAAMANHCLDSHDAGLRSPAVRSASKRGETDRRIAI